MADKITREEALELYDKAIRDKLDKALDEIMTASAGIDKVAHIRGAFQAAAVGNAIANAENPAIMIVVDDRVYLLDTGHMDIVDPIFRALEEIVNLGKAEVAKMQDPTTKETMGGSWDA